MRCQGYVRVGLMAAVAVLCGAWFIAPSVAEEAQPKPVKHKVMGHYNRLDLTEDQRKQIAEIQDEYRVKINALREEERQKIVATLTPEQTDKLEQMKKEWQDKAKGAHDKKHDQSHSDSSGDKAKKAGKAKGE